MARRPSARSLSRLRTYTVEEAARLLGVHRNTVRRWLRQGLESIDRKKPFLIHGSDLIAFLKARKPKTRKLAPQEGYCFSCRSPRGPAFGEVEVKVAGNGRLTLTALCETCATVMNKKLARDLLKVLEADAAVTVTLVPTRIDAPEEPCRNVHFKEERHDHAASPSEK